MSKRTPENCGIIKKWGEPGRDGNGLCMGFARSEIDDEPCEPCKSVNIAQAMKRLKFRRNRR